MKYGGLWLLCEESSYLVSSEKKNVVSCFLELSMSFFTSLRSVGI